MNRANNNKLQGKDFITCGIFSLLAMVGMVLAAVMNISGYTAIFYPAVASFFIGILYVIVSCKVPKRFAVLIFGIVPCAYFFASGLIEGVIGSIGVILLSFIAEAILGKERPDAAKITVSGLVYTLYMSVIGMAENFILTDKYCDDALAHGIDGTIVEQMRQMYGMKWLWAVVIAATALCTFVGIAIGKAIMKKHLRKAGLV